MGMKELCAQLSAIQGASLIAEQCRLPLDAHSRVLFLGLGGLGCQTINILKGMVQRDFENADHVRFLAVDSDEQALNDLTLYYSPESETARLSMQECICLYRQNPLLISPVVSAWLSSHVSLRPPYPRGTHAIRAIGRALLCGTQNYQVLQVQINALLGALCKGMAPADRLSVVIVSGLSGETGSGMFVDMSYMVRLLLNRLRDFPRVECEQYGVFFTADVQRSIPSIREDPALFAQLQSNAYAAMKELDYFVNAGSLAPDAEPIYTLPLPDGTQVQTAEPMFDDGKVFLVNGPEEQDCGEILEQTAAGLLNLFRVTVARDVEAPGYAFPLIRNCPRGYMSLAWRTKNVGEPANRRLPADPCGIRNTEFPASMNYSFSGLGFRSVCFPINEMAAFCANRVFRRVFDKWVKQAADITDEDTLRFAAEHDIGCEDQIYQLVLRALSVDTDTLSIRFEESALSAVGILGFGLKDAVEATLQETDHRVEAILTCITDIRWYSSPLRPVTAALEDPEFLLRHGPFAAEAILAGADGSGGLIGLLDHMGKNVVISADNCAFELREAKQRMQTEAELLKHDHFLSREEKEAFLCTCGDYARASLKSAFFKLYMPEILFEFARELRNVKDTVFDDGILVLRAVRDVLGEDADAFQIGMHRQTPSLHAYCADAFCVPRSGALGDPILEMLAREADTADADALAERIVGSCFGCDGALWSSFRMEDPDEIKVMANRIRCLFHNSISPAVDNMLEKYMVLAYADPETLQQRIGHPGAPTFRELNSVIWNDIALRDQALNSAAENIVRFLAGNETVDFAVPDEIRSRFLRAVSVVLLEETPNLNAAIRQRLDQTYRNNYSCTEISCRDCKSAITMTTIVRPFPPAMLKGVREAAEAYFETEKTVFHAAGRHLDEVTERWQTYLPELYGEDAEAYFTQTLGMPEMVIPDSSRPVGHDGRPINHERELYERLRAAISFGLDHGFIRRGVIWLGMTDRYYRDYYLVLPKPADSDALRALEQIAAKLSWSGISDVWADTLRAMEQKTGLPAYREYPLSGDPDLVSAALRETDPADREQTVSLLCRVIRTSMPMTRRVVSVLQTEQTETFFRNLRALGSFVPTVEAFCQAYMLGMITHDTDRGWLLTCSGRPEDAPIAFFEDTQRRRIEILDVPLRWYLVISAFSRIADSDRLQDLGARYADAKETGRSLLSCDGIIDALNAALAGPTGFEHSYKIIPVDALHHSHYRDYYRFPCGPVDSPETVFENIVRVRDCLEALRAQGRIV